MHRTQIMLEESQYNWLLEESRHVGKSMGELVRELIDAVLKKASGKAHRYKLADTSGIFQRGDVCGRDHDKYLYGGK